MYVPASNTLENVGFEATNSTDFGFADIKAAIGTLSAGGVESFLSMWGLSLALTAWLACAHLCKCHLHGTALHARASRLLLVWNSSPFLAVVFPLMPRLSQGWLELWLLPGYVHAVLRWWVRFCQGCPQRS